MAACDIRRHVVEEADREDVRTDPLWKGLSERHQWWVTVLIWLFTSPNPLIYKWGLTTTSLLSLSGVILHQTCWEPPFRLSCTSYLTLNYEDACLCQFIKDVYCCFLHREKYLFKNRTTEVPPNSYYRSLYPKIIQDIEVGKATIVLSLLSFY